MKSIILCEGGTDLTLIQYFMEKANNWRYDKQVKLFKLKQAKQLKNNENTLVIELLVVVVKSLNIFLMFWKVIDIQVLQKKLILI